MNNIVIIGAGQAGARVAFSLRENGWDGNITLIGEESYLPYERPPLSKDFLTGEQSLESLYIATAEEYKTSKIDVLLNTKVVEIFTDLHQVKTDNNALISYSFLIFATGAQARQLELEKANLVGIHTLRNVNDANLLNTALTNAQHVAILGGGFIGLEVAAAARKLGIKTTLIEQNHSCLNRVLPSSAADPIIEYHKNNDVQIVCGKSILAINGHDKVESLVLDDYSIVSADVVVVGIGSIPNDELAKKIGLDCPNGISVNSNCQTSVENIYAIGDVACHYDNDYSRLLRLESWENAEEQAKKAAKHILSNFDHTNTASIPWFWTDQYNLNVQVLGKPTLGILRATRADPSPYKSIQFYFQEATLIGAVLFGNGKEKRTVSKLIGTQLDPQILSDSAISLKSLI